ncbi:MAG: AMP-binding protein, partial [Bacteroidota bacterium]
MIFQVAAVPPSEATTFSIEYATAVYSKRFVRQLGHHLMEVLEQFRDLNQSVAACPMLTTQEEKQLLVDFNNTTAPFPKGQTIIDLFEHQAKLNPDAQALIFAEQTWSYRDLNEASNELAHQLIQQGLGIGDIAGIALERSADLIIAILAVWKTGAAYVPISPEYPRERVEFIIRDTELRIVLATTALRDLLSSNLAAVLWLDQQQRALPNNKKELSRKTEASELAYLIYTSGSTGQPKGVMITHQNLTMRLQGMVDLMQLDQTLVVGMLTNFIFDVSLLEFALPLMIGGSVVVPSQATLYDLKALLNLLARTGVTKLQVTPSYLHQLIGAVDAPIAAALKLERICSGGEPLKKELVAQVKAKLPQVKLNNHYGPTEATIDAIALNDIQEYHNNWIGQPLPNTCAYIVDSALD